MSSEQPERFDLASALPTDDRLAALRAAFPEVFREDKVDFEALRRSLGDWVDPGPERFGLSWPGKAECMRVIQQPSIGTLVPMLEESVDWDTTKNVIIEGENLEVLKLMQKAYYGKVKLIYIDPPYNTGKEFIYPDNFREGLTDYLRYSGQVDDEGFKLSANAETDGRYHSKWLSMMYPRLFLARNLLREDGVIFVSIDDHEVHNLRALMNEIFGEENFVACIAWQSLDTIKNDAPRFSDNHEYILCFSRALESCRIGGLERTPEQDAKYVNRDNDPHGPYLLTPLHAKSGSDAGIYEYVFETGQRWTPPPGTYPRFSRKRLRELEVTGGLLLDPAGLRVPQRKTYLSDLSGGVRPTTFWGYDRFGSTRRSNAELKRLLGPGVFENSKPVSLISSIIEIATGPDDLVFDFFAGSGTTGHAVMAQNDREGARRRFVLVQLPEAVENAKFSTIAAIMRQRIECVGEELRSTPKLASEAVDTGFRSLHLVQSNFTIWDAATTEATGVEEQLAMSVDHVVAGATEASMLTELLLKAGYPLTSPVAEVSFAGVPGYSVAEGALLVCLAKGLSIEAFEAMVELEPAMILVLDAGFGGSDELKVNALQTVRARNQRVGSDIALLVV